MKGLKKKGFIGFIIITVLIVTALSMLMIKTASNKSQTNDVSVQAVDPELALSRTYETFDDEDKAIENTENVEFSAFFLRDLDGDGYAEKIKGSCKKLGGEDTLYMELVVKTEGYLKDGKITINGNNFYFKAAIPKDDEIKENRVGNQVEDIPLNDIASGTQKLFTGIVRSGTYTTGGIGIEALKNNAKNYSRDDNSVVLTGTYVTEAGEEIPIRKEIQLSVDWYGEASTKIKENIKTYVSIGPNNIKEEEGVLELVAKIEVMERKKELLLKNNITKVYIPKFNGYAPCEISVTTGDPDIEIINQGDEDYDFFDQVWSSGWSETNTIISFDKDNFELDQLDANKRYTTVIIKKEAPVNEEGYIESNISRDIYYDVVIKYPLDAYRNEKDFFLDIPIKSRFVAFSNPHEEFEAHFNNHGNFEGLYYANIDKITAHYNFHTHIAEEFGIRTIVGDYLLKPYSRHIVSKAKPLNIYNEITASEPNDTYPVRWEVFTGEKASKLSLFERNTNNNKEYDYFVRKDGTMESMEDKVFYVGISFENFKGAFEDEGWIKVIDEDTNEVLLYLDKNSLNTSSTYYYNYEVKRIRVETSTIKSETSFAIEHIKRIDVDALTDKYTYEEFKELDRIETYLAVYKSVDSQVSSTSSYAIYEGAFSNATISTSRADLSTQATEEDVEIIIETEENFRADIKGWNDGIFMIKVPDNILDIIIKDISITNPTVEISSYEIIEKENGKFIKIVVDNVNNEDAAYKITLLTDITANPRASTGTDYLELYGVSYDSHDYYRKASDIYDINENGNVAEKVNYTTTQLRLLSPNSLLTDETVSDFDDKGTVVMSPKVADVAPIFGDNVDDNKTAKIGIRIKNNYLFDISEISILGKIPYEGNTYVLSNKDLNSDFGTEMTDDGIEVPEEIAGRATVYYSELENPTTDLTNAENGWKEKEEVENFSQIKSYLIKLNDVVLNRDQTYEFFYKVIIPDGIPFNEETFAHHGVYFTLNTPEGKYRTKTEPNKVGIRIAQKYSVKLFKYQTDRDNLVSGAMYAVSELDSNREVTGYKTAVTNDDGVLVIKDLYSDKTYLISEINSPDNYELNYNIIEITSYTDMDTGIVYVEKVSGETREDLSMNSQDIDDQIVTVKVEDEAKATLSIIKKDEATGEVIPKVKFRVVGPNLPENGKVITTNQEGKATLKGLSIDSTYIVTEEKADGYYIDNEIQFYIVNENGEYDVEIENGMDTSVEKEVTEEGNIPKLILTFEDEAIPTYDLEIMKYREVVGEGPTTIEEPLEGAKFNLYKEGRVLGSYISDENGLISIPGLYLYDSEKAFDQTYVLEEVLTPEGYSKARNLTFKVYEHEGTLILDEDVEYEEEARRYEVDGNKVKVYIKDNPVFKLVKFDGETNERIPNTKFAFYTLNGETKPAVDSKGNIIGEKEIIDGKEYYVVTTDANGEISLDLPDGLYKAREVESLDKYDLTDAAYYFGIGQSGRINEWKESFEIEGFNNIYYTIQTPDGGYFVGMQVQGEQTLDNYRIHGETFIKYDANYEIEWVRSFDLDQTYYGLSQVAILEDGSILLAGDFMRTADLDGEYNFYYHDSSNAFKFSDTLLVKLSMDGNIEWARTYASSDTETPFAVEATSDGGFLIGGYHGERFSIDGISIYYSGYLNAHVIKFNSEGRAVWGKGYGDRGSYTEETVALIEVDDGYIAAIHGNYLDANTRFQSGSGTFLVKYDYNGNEIWKKALSGMEITDMTYVDNGEFLVSASAGNQSYVIKFDESGNELWRKSYRGPGYFTFKNLAYADDEIIVVGDFLTSYSNDWTTYYDPYVELENGFSLYNYGYRTGFIFKFTPDGVLVDVQQVSGNDTQEIIDISPTADGGYIYSGTTNSEEITLNDGEVLPGTGGYDDNGYYSNRKSFIVKVSGKDGAQQLEELNVYNKRKEYKIQTRVNEIDDVKGGTISGDDVVIYEKVKYGDASEKEIRIVPDQDYHVISLKVNGEDWYPEYEDDGSYLMPQFENVTENILIEVTFAMKDNTITINKTDEETGEAMPGVTFKLDQLDEREANPNEGLSDLVNNLTPYSGVRLIEEADGILGPKVDKDNYYFEEVTQDGETYLICTNGKEYQESIGNTEGIKNTVANSYFEIDLTDKTDNYAIVVSSKVGSEGGYDIGYATITDSETIPTYSNTNGRFMYVSGEGEKIRNYTSKLLEAGNKYYLHLGYRKNGGSDYNGDFLKIYDIKLYKAEEADEYYTFVEENGVLKSTNTDRYQTTATAYIPIDLRNYEGKYNIIVNANVASYPYDYGYLYVSESETTPTNDEAKNGLAYISGSGEPKNYVEEVDGGKYYYLHLGFINNSPIYYSEDIFYINSIMVENSDSGLYHTEATTNSQGQAITQVPFGKYMVTEVETPEGYCKKDGPEIIEFRSYDGAPHEFTITNKKLREVIVHHYEITEDGTYTTNKVAEDELLYGKVGENYFTYPNLDIPLYDLEKDNDGNYIIPKNSNGQFDEDPIEIIYYYLKQDALLRVNYLIQGTNNPVPLSNGENSTNIIETGKEGEEYSTEPLPEDEINSDYVLVAMPDNASGVFKDTEEVVNYYYKLKSFVIKTGVIPTTVDVFNTTTNVSEEQEVIGGTISGEEDEIYEEVTIKQDSEKDIIIEPAPGFKVEKILVNDEPIDFTEEADGTVILDKFTYMLEDKNVLVGFAIDNGKVIVHHYLEGTEEKIKDHDGNEIPDEEKNNFIGNIYITKPREDLEDRYELAIYPDNSSGLYEAQEIHVYYYYRLKDAVVTVNHYIMNSDGTKTEDPVPLKEEGKFAESETINIKVDGTYETNPIDPEELNEVYELSEMPDNANGVANTDTVEVNYYYIPKEAKVIIHYKDVDTGEPIHEDGEIKKRIGDSYEALPISITNYIYDSDSDNTQGTMTKDPIEVTFYYKQNINNIVERHVDSYTNEIIEEEAHSGYSVGDEYKIDPKEFDGYVLDESKLPDNAEGTIEEFPLEVVYYYKHEAKVIVRYIDEATNEVIEETEENKFYGDSYEVSPKDIASYDIDEERLPDNSSGTVEADEVIVTFYYKHKAKVIENHIDVDTDEKLEQKEYNGHVGDKYYTSSKEIEGYDLVEERLPENRNGEMTLDTIEVNYYYKKQAEVIVEYIDFYTGEKIDGNTTYHGHIGDSYEVSPKDIEGYKLLEAQKPTNDKGDMTKDPITVTYFYVKESTVTERHVYNDKVLEEVVHEGLEGDPYNIEPKEFEKYILDEDRLPENKDGYMEDKDIVVTYYYVDKAVVIEKHIDEETREILAYEKHEGRVGDKYNIPARTFPGYDKIYASTDNNRGYMTQEPIEVIFYYTKTKKETPAQEEQKTEPQSTSQAAAPVTVIVKDGNGNTKSTVTAKSGDTVVVNKTNTNVTSKVDPDEVVRSVPDTDSETNRIFYAVAAVLVLVGVVIIVVVAIINKKKSKEE